MPPSDHERVRHMGDALTAAIAFAAGPRRADLDVDRMLAFALVRDVEIIGEAATNVSEATQRRFPEIPWKQAARMRNRLIHAYFDVDLDILWTTVTEDLPALLPTIEAAIAELRA